MIDTNENLWDVISGLERVLEGEPILYYSFTVGNSEPVKSEEVLLNPSKQAYSSRHVCLAAFVSAIVSCLATGLCSLAVTHFGTAANAESHVCQNQVLNGKSHALDLFEMDKFQFLYNGTKVN